MAKERPTQGQEDPNGGFERILRMLAEREAARLPDGAYREYKGKVRQSELDFVAPLPLVQATQTIQRTFDGTFIPWGTDRAVAKIHSEVFPATSLYQRSLYAIIDNPGTPESEEVFGILTSQIEDVDPATLVDDVRATTEWWQKVSMLGETYGFIQKQRTFDRRAYGETQPTPDSEHFTQTFESHLEQTRDMIGQLGRDRLQYFLSLYDAYNETENFTDIRFKPSRKGAVGIRRDIPKELYDLMRDVTGEVSNAWLDISYPNMHVPLYEKWDELQADWQWEDVTQVLAVVPDMRATDTVLKVIDAVEDNLEATVKGVVSPSAMSAEGIAKMVHLDIEKNTHGHYLMDMPDMEPDEEKTVTIGQKSFPRDVVPATTVKLLTEIGSQSEEGAFHDLLGRIQTEVAGKKQRIPTTMHEWLLVLTLVRENAHGDLKQQVENFVAADTFPHKQFKDVFLGQKPGNIYLMENGTLRVTDHGIARGICLYTSPYETPEEPPQPATSAPTVLFVHTPTRNAPPEGTKKKKRRHLPRHESGADTTETTQSATSRPRPTVDVPQEDELRRLAGRLSSRDLDLVGRVLHDPDVHIIPLRARASDGRRQYKIRVNGHDSGIRVLLVAEGNNQFKITSINYRGNAYKRL